MQEYISYGLGNKFDINKFKEIKNIKYFCKPKYGLWASPVDSDNSWKNWCEEEQFRDCTEENSFKFTIDNKANVYYINSVEDAKKMPQIQYDEVFKTLDTLYPDFEKMQKDGIDAIQFNLSNDEDLYFALYGWDCDSIVIMNKNIIIPTEKK